MKALGSMAGVLSDFDFTSDVTSDGHARGSQVSTIPFYNSVRVDDDSAAAAAGGGGDGGGRTCLSSSRYQAVLLNKVGKEAALRADAPLATCPKAC